MLDQMRVQRSPCESAALQSIGNRPPGEVWVQDVRPMRFRRVFLDVCRFPNADITGAVEQGAVLIGMDGQPQLAIGFKEFPAFHNMPYAIGWLCE